MRRYFVAFLLCLLANISFAQKEDFPKPDVVAEFPGGQESMMQFVHKNLKYPKDCEKERINGRVVVSFIVEKDGSLSNFRVMMSPDKRLSEEVLRIVGLMPKWKPALRDKQPIQMRYAIPVTFRLPDKPVPIVGNVWEWVDKETSGAKENPRGLYRLVKLAYEDGTKKDVPFLQYKYCGDSLTLQIEVARSTDKEFLAQIYDNDGYEFKYSDSMNKYNTRVYDSNDKGFKFKWYNEHMVNNKLFPFKQYITEMYSSKYLDLSVLSKSLVDMLKMKTATDSKLYGCWHRIGVVTQIEGLDMFLAAPAPQELYQVFDKDMSLQVYDLTPGQRLRAYCVLRPITYKENDIMVQRGTEYKIDWIKDDLFKLNFDRGDGTIVTEVWKRSGLPRNYQRIFGTNLPTYQIVNPDPNYFRLETRQE